MEHYVGTKRIQAERDDRDGEPGYAVVYPDGYRSWSPLQAFRESYRKSGRMDFGHALYLVKRGFRISRSGWNGKGLWVEAQWPDAHSKMTLPYLYLCYPADAEHTPGARVPWLASQTDMMAEDWGVVE